MNTLTLSDAAPLTTSRAEPASWALGAAEPHRTLGVDGLTLAYDDAGRGPAVVCLHAIGHGARDFARLRARLAPAYRVVALDWPGQGRSSADTVPASGARYTALLGGALDALGIERGVLVGNSIGGAAAIRYAAGHPERVRGLVVENPGGLDGVDRLARMVTGAMAAFFAAGVRGARWYPAAFAAYYRLVLQRRPAAADRARIVAAAREIAPVLRDAWQSFGCPDADLRALAVTVRCPVLFAWATRDQFVQLRRSRATIRAMPTARLETFAAGHAPHLETPEAFEASVAAFLAGLAP